MIGFHVVEVVRVLAAVDRDRTGRVDARFSDDEAMDWLLEPEESLGTSPIEALRAGRKAEVRRVAQALA